MPHTLNDVPRPSNVGSRAYTNADLKRRPRVFPGPDIPFPEGVDVVEPEYPIQNDRPAVEAILRQAKEALDRARELSVSSDAPTLANLPNRVSELQHESANIVPSLRGGTEEFSRATMGFGNQPDIIRRLIAPEEDESRLGAIGDAAIEAALYAGPFALAKYGGPALKATLGPEARRLRQAKKSKFFGRVVGENAGKSREIPFASSQQAQNPNKIAEMVRNLAAESGDPVEDVLQRSRRAIPGGRSARDAILRLIQSGTR